MSTYPTERGISHGKKSHWQSYLPGIAGVLGIVANIIDGGPFFTAEHTVVIVLCVLAGFSFLVKKQT